MTKPIRITVGILTISIIVVWGIFITHPANPHIHHTIGINATMLQTRLEQRFLERGIQDGQASMFDAWNSNRLNQVVIGQTFTEPGDDGNFHRYQVVAIEDDGISFEYLSHFDHRTWGHALIEKDRGRLKLRWSGE